VKSDTDDRRLKHPFRILSLFGVMIMKSTLTSRSGQDPSPDNVMDVRDALQRLGDDVELFRDIVQIYLEDSPEIVAKIHRAADQSDFNSLQRAAHSLKGLAATLSAADVVGAAARLEHSGAVHDLTDAARMVAEVDERVQELNMAVRNFLQRK
jgi:HPt (histidine-containing phosphotransfer) domain-containing protein